MAPRSSHGRPWHRDAERGPQRVVLAGRAVRGHDRDGARQAVRELAAKKVDIVKIWVDDRNKTVTPLPPSLYRPIIQEAHTLGLRVVAHVYYLADAKELLRAGIDGFAHGIRDLEVDDEIMELFKERPQVFVIPNLPDTPPFGQDLAVAQ